MDARYSAPEARSHNIAEGGCNGDYASMLSVVGKLEGLLAGL